MMNYSKATNEELRTIIFDDKQATTFDRAEAKHELDKRKQKRLSGKVVNYVR